MKRRLFAVTVLLLLCCGMLLPVAAKTDIPNPTNSFFVNDFANVIDDADEQIIQAAGERLYAASGAQVVVVTVPSLEGEAIENYALKLARAWGIGDKDKDNGLLLLLSVAEPKVRIEVGSGLEGAIPDSKAGRILDTYMIPNYEPGKFTTGLVNTYDALVNEVYIEYGLDADNGYTPIDEVSPEEESSPLSRLFKLALIIGAIILLIRHPQLLWIFLHFGGRGGHGGSSGGRSGGSRGGFSGGGGGFSGGGASR